MTLGIDTARYGLLQTVIDSDSYARSVERFKHEQILLPTFAQLADPSTIPASITNALNGIDKDDAHPLNLFRVHWYNGWGRTDRVDLPEHIVLPRELTGVDAKIVLVFGNRFPMIGAHKVLAAYSCLVPRMVSGQFDPTRHRAIWPSTGNYARGGIAISRLMQSRGVAVLPENMSQERFDWLDAWVPDPEDVIRTPGSESNVKEIYDACNELAKDPSNFILNQFSEFANHIGHYAVTGERSATCSTHLSRRIHGWNWQRLRQLLDLRGPWQWAIDSRTTTATKIVAVEALECPTMLYNGYGEHNIQGIGDKHIPLIHNVMNTDIAAAVSDEATDGLNLVFTTDVGKTYLKDKLGVDEAIIEQLRHFGFSSICNTIAAIKTAKQLGLGEHHVVISVATDGSEIYTSEKAAYLASQYPNGFGESDAAAIVSRHLLGAGTDHIEELDAVGRERIFNLGYFTWVEQQGVSLDDFDVRRDQQFWKTLHGMAPAWDAMIEEFNAATGVTV